MSEKTQISLSTDEEKLFLAVAEGYTRLRRLGDSILKQHNLTIADYNLLRIALNSPTCTLSEVAQRLHAQAPAVTTIIKRLEYRGLVVISALPKDKRVRIVKLTPQGIVLTEQIFAQMSKFPHKLGIPNIQVKALVQGLRELNRLLAKDS